MCLLCTSLKVELLITGGHINIFRRGANGRELRPRPFELMELLRCEFERDEVVYGEAGFHHFVSVDSQLPVVSPFELCKVLWLEVHGEHVVKRESECNGIVYRVGHFAPWDFVFYKVFWYVSLLFERGE